MKSLMIKSDGCLLEKNSYQLKIDDEEIQNLIKKELPPLEDFKKYPIKIALSIDFLGGKGLEVETTGYKTEKPQEETDNE